MKRNLLLSLGCALVFHALSYSQNNVKNNTDSSVKKEEIVSSEPKKEKTTKATKKLRKLHAQHLKNSPFRKTLNLSKTERKATGIPPNKYYEQEWELTMNPEVGRPTTESLNALRDKLNKERRIALETGRTPGDAVDNAWVERGPNNVGGRVRAIMFDPNDAAYNTVFASGVSGGLWKNTNISNAATAWTRVNIAENLNITSLAYDPNNTQIFYAGTGESYVAGDVNGNGLWKSTNAGATWTRVLGGISGPSFFQSASNLTINSPAGIAGNYASINTTAFGPAITVPITADIALVNDGVPDTTDGCTALPAGSLTGKIALIRRGSCNFVIKVKEAQNAGAIAAIVMNNAAGAGPMAMGGTDATITIPSTTVSKEHGDIIQAAVGLGTVNATINPGTAGIPTGVIVPGIQNINDVVVRNNGGTSEVIVAVGDGYYSSANAATLQGPSNYGLYKSSDGGANWTQLTLPLTAAGNKHCPNDIEIAIDNKIWVSTTDSWVFGDGGGKVFSSADGGTTFVDRHTVTGNGGGERVEIETSGTNANKIYVLSELSQAVPNTPTIEVKLEMTTDGFATAPTALNLPAGNETRETTYGFTGGQAFYDLMIESDPTNDAILYVGGIDLYRSANSGTSWVTISNWTIDVHADQHAMAFKPNNSNIGIFGTDGGVYYSGSLSTTAVPATSRVLGLNVTQFYSLGVSPKQSVSGLANDYFAAGAQDNGTQYFGGVGAGVNGSVESQGGDGAFTMFSQDGDDYYISNYVYNNSINYRAIPAGTVRSLDNDSNTDANGQFITPMALDSSLDLLYSDYSAGTVYQIRRYGNIKSGIVQRNNLTNALLTSNPTALTVSKYTTASTTLLVGTRNGRLLRLTNANATPTWTDITGANFVGSVSDVEYGASNDEIFVTMHNYNVVSIWYTANGTSATPTWVNKEGNFPDIPVKCILQNPLSPNEVIIGTELGVWFTNNFNNASPNWNQSYNGMSNVKVTDMDIQGDSGSPTSYNVYAATYGRGIFSGQFTSELLSNEDNVLQNNSISVYPTISNGNITLISNKHFGQSQLELFDLTGKKVFTDKIELKNIEQKVNLGNLSTGNYILKLSGEGFIGTKKIIIE